MEKREKKPTFKEMKLRFAVAIGYFNHTSIFLNVIMTTFITLVAGIATVGFSNLIYPLLIGNYIHMIYLFLLFSALEILIRYLFYIFNFNVILKSRGIMLFPYYLIIFYVVPMFLKTEFTSFLAIFGFVILFSLVRGGINYMIMSIKNFFSKEVRL